MSHQKAAHLLITTLYTPQTMMKNDFLRKTLHWYIRFDTFVGIMSGTGTQLAHEWFEVQHRYFAEQCEAFPADLALKYEERFAWVRLTGLNMSQLIRRQAQGLISVEEFKSQLDLFHQRVLGFRDALHPMLTDRSKLVYDISNGRTRDPDDIVDPYEPNLLYGGDRFETNILLLDFYGFELIFNNQLASLQGKPDPAGARKCALKIGQTFEAMQYYEGSPPGIVLGMQAGLALAVLFLHQDEREIMWGRRKIATIEALGCVSSLRCLRKTLLT
jgi:hypothetical protein